MKMQYVTGCVALVSMSLMLSGCAPLSKIAIKSFLKVNEEKVGEYCGKQNLGMSNITENLWWPGCGLINGMPEFATKCPADGCIKKETMQAMDDFNTVNGGEKVTYKSRAGTGPDGKPIEVVDLVGWWLPAPGATATTPRIVLQHGFTSNSNKFRTMFTAYLLRKLGYSVLVNNLRDHCYSQDTATKLVKWGHAYPQDLLGAWDYAKVLGGKPLWALPSSKVGLLGFSMGGFTTNNAFGLEPEIPAAWIDGAPISPKEGFAQGYAKSLKEKGVGFIAKPTLESVWKDIQEHAAKAGIDLNENLPEKVLPNGPDTQRPIFITANKGDTTVPFSSAEALKNLVLQYPAKYKLVDFWAVDGNCAGKTHCVDMLARPEEYTAKLCTFWAGVFGTDSSGCAAASLRLYSQEGWRYESVASGLPVLMVVPTLAAALGLAVIAHRLKSRQASTQQVIAADTEGSDAEE